VDYDVDFEDARTAVAWRGGEGEGHGRRRRHGDVKDWFL
jgi:hypothetical protein